MARRQQHGHLPATLAAAILARPASWSIAVAAAWGAAAVAAAPTGDAHTDGNVVGSDGVTHTVLPLIVGAVCSAAALGAACLFGGSKSSSIGGGKPPTSAASYEPPANGAAPAPGGGRSVAPRMMASPPATSGAAVQMSRGGGRPPAPVHAAPPPNVQELYSKPQKRSRPSSVLTAPPPSAGVTYDEVDRRAGDRLPPPVLYRLNPATEQFSRITLEEAENTLEGGGKVFTTPQHQAAGSMGECAYEAVENIGALYSRPVKNDKRGGGGHIGLPDNQAPNAAELYTAVVKPKRGGDRNKPPTPTPYDPNAIEGAAGGGLSGSRPMPADMPPPPAVSESPRRSVSVSSEQDYENVEKSAGGRPMPAGVAPPPKRSGRPVSQSSEQDYENIDKVVSRMSSPGQPGGSYDAGSGQGQGGGRSASGEVYQNLDQFISPSSSDQQHDDAVAMRQRANEANYVPLAAVMGHSSDQQLYEPLESLTPQQQVGAPTFVMHGSAPAAPPMSENDRNIAAWQKVDMSREDAERYLYAAR